MSKITILIVDDEPSIRRALREILEFEGHTIEEAEDGDSAIQKIKAKKYDAVFLDIKMPGKDGMEVLAEISDKLAETPVIMLSGHGTIDIAVDAIRAGAFDFMEKPPDLNRILVSIRNAIDREVLVRENKQMRTVIAEKQDGSITPIIGESKGIAKIKRTIEKVAPTEARVLVTGEAGTGKELIAQWVHHLSPRKEKPLIEVNCAAIPSELIESELFGHEKGAFTGATKQRIGKFEQANGGTLFLDEIGDMSLSAQAKVLRVLQEHRITRVGGDQVINIDVRIVAATNKNLLEMVDEGLFREDLYHRLGVILLHLPPLRERRMDIPPIAQSFLSMATTKNGLPAITFTKGALEKLRQLDWRGNIRELSNVVERLVILCDEDQIDVEDIDLYARPRGGGSNPILEMLDQCDQFSDFRDLAEKLFIERKLEQFNWNISKTAESIGIQRSHLYNKLKKYDIAREED